MFDRIGALLKKEFLQVFRDPRMRFVIFVSPVVQIFIFGYAATMDITHVPIAVNDRDNTKQSRQIIHDFSYSQYFDIKYYVREPAQENDLIDKTKVLGILKMDRSFARDLVGNNNAQIQMIVDGTDSNSASIILNYAGQIIQAQNARILNEKAASVFGLYSTGPQVDLRDRRWFNPNLESRNYYLPGVIVLIVTIMSLLLSAMAIVREKEIGTMEQLIVSPIRPFELIIGKVVPFGIIAVVQVTLITIVGIAWFGVPFHGSITLLFVCTLLYLLTTLGAGLFLSTMCSTQQEAMMSVFLFNFPMTLLSGFAYPIANMPKVIQFLTIFNPQRYYLTIIRYIFLKGVGIKVLIDEILILIVFGVVVIAISSTRFQKRLG